METFYEKKLKFFLRNSAGRTGHPYTKEKKNSHEFTQFKSINSRWITNLHVKCKTKTPRKQHMRKFRWPWFWQ